MKFKLIAAILGLGLMMATPGAVRAQNPDDQTLDQDSKPSPNIPVQGPNDQGSMDQDSMDQGSMDQGSGDQTYNTPAPVETNGVARISLIHGDVSTQRGDSGDWSAAVLNAPVVAGDRVSTGDRARTELQLDYANMFRLAEHSQANINTLTRSQIQIQLGRGMANYTVFKNSDADAEIDTPNVAIRTNRQESSFRILVTADDHTEVLVRRGEVDVTTPQGGTRVAEGQFITVVGTGDQTQYKIGEAPARDDFDQWNTDRDNMIRNSVSRRHTNDYYVGTEDLDDHGTWSEIPDYGPVWRPNETDPDWAPYRDGHWVYEPYWGWTWVPYEDWGWAPYHYGRWMMYDGAWAWWPGPVYGYPFYRPIWAPAYVSFFGWGGGVGFGFGGGWGSVGWLPLGPCDHFHPWWGAWGGGRFNSININVYNRGGFAPLHGGNRFSNVNLALHDPHFRGGTTVRGNEFGRSHMSARPTSHEAFRNANFTNGRVPVTPGRESFSASGRPAAPSTMRHVSQNQHFFSARGNTASASHSFGRGGMQTSNGNPQFGRSTGNGREVQRPGNNTASNNGFRRSDRPNSEAGSRSMAPSTRPETRGNSNWGSAPRSGNSGGSTVGRESRGGNAGGWQKFSPMPARPSSESGRGNTPAARAEGRGSYGSRSSAGAERGSYGSPRNAAPESRGSYGSPRSAAPESRGSYGSPRSAAPESRGSYRSPRGAAPESRGSYGSPRSAAPESRGSYGSPRGAAPESRGSYGSPRGYSQEGRGYGGYSRPPLNMRQPIVTPRSYGGSPYGGNRGSYGGGGVRSAPSYGDGGRSAPSFGGGHSAPSGGSSHGGGGGSSHGGGGGSSHGGGGSRHGR